MFLIAGALLLAMTLFTIYQQRLTAEAELMELQRKLQEVNGGGLPMDLQLDAPATQPPAALGDKAAHPATQAAAPPAPPARAVRPSASAPAPAPAPAAPAAPRVIVAPRPPPPRDPNDPLEQYNIAGKGGTAEEAVNIKGVEDLEKAGVPVPMLAFDYDESSEAKADRFRTEVDRLVAEGMPEAAAQLRAQLFERELADKKARAIHARNRAIVRLRQEIKLKQDAEEREARLSLMAAKQKMVDEMLEKNKIDREESEQRKEERKKEMEEDDRKRREEAEKIRLMKEQIRMEHLEKQQGENDRRRDEEKAEKEEERLAREKAIEDERQEKRSMLEEFQALRQQQMEENKRLAREERLLEMQEAAERRKQQEELLGLRPAGAGDDTQEVSGSSGSASLTALTVHLFPPTIVASHSRRLTFPASTFPENTAVNATCTAGQCSAV